MSSSLFYFYFLWCEHLWFPPLGKFHIISLLSCKEASSSGLLLWWWKIDCIYFRLHTLTLSSRTRENISFSSIKRKNQAPLTCATWSRFLAWTIILRDTSGIYLIMGLNWRLPGPLITCHIVKDDFYWWPHADQSPRIHMNAQSTIQNPHGGHRREMRRTRS